MIHGLGISYTITIAIAVTFTANETIGLFFLFLIVADKYYAQDDEY